MTTLVALTLCIVFGLELLTVPSDAMCQDQCRFYLKVSRKVQQCTNNLLPPSSTARASTAADIQARYDIICDDLTGIQNCVETFTDECLNKDVIRKQANLTYGFSCSDGNWLTNIALPGLNDMDPSCWNIRHTMCRDSYRHNAFRHISANTGFAEALEIRKHNMDEVLRCMIEDVREGVAEIPHCSTPWQDVIVYMIVELWGLPTIGNYLHAEQKNRLAQIRAQSLLGLNL